MYPFLFQREYCYGLKSVVKPSSPKSGHGYAIFSLTNICHVDGQCSRSYYLYLLTVVSNIPTRVTRFFICDLFFLRRDVPTFGLYMVIYESLIKKVAGSEDEAGPLSLIFCGGMAGEELILL